LAGKAVGENEAEPGVDDLHGLRKTVQDLPQKGRLGIEGGRTETAGAQVVSVQSGNTRK
jgi:hypothetical protein